MGKKKRTGECGRVPSRLVNQLPSRRRQLAVLSLLLPALLIAIMGWIRRWSCDDAFITFRVANNLASGHGPVFNVGERVEAITNPAWMVLLSLWDLLFGGIGYGPVFLGIAFAVLAVVIGQIGALKLARRGTEQRILSDVHIPAGMLVFVAVPAVWDYTTSGLETSLGLLWLASSFAGVCHTAISKEPSDRRLSWNTRLVAVCIGIGPLIRPDFAIYAMGFLGGLIVASSRGLSWVSRVRRLAVIGCLCGALPVAVEVFRLGYYASLVPNTALAKEAWLANWAVGWLYFRDFFGTYLLWIPLLALVPFYWYIGDPQTQLRGHARLLQGVSIFCGVIHLLYVVRVGGDFMHGRQLIPALFTILLPVASVKVAARPWSLKGVREPIVLLGMTVALCWVCICGLTLRVSYEDNRGSGYISDERGYYVAWSGVPNPVTLSDYADTDTYRGGMRLRQLAEYSQVRFRSDLACHSSMILSDPAELATPLVCLPLDTSSVGAGIDVLANHYAIGIFSSAAAARVHVMDHIGLSDPIAARLELQERRRTGHEKYLPREWVIARFAQLPADGAIPPAILQARRALECEPFPTLISAVSEELSWGRFFENIGLAWQLNRFRFPADPGEAASQLCGTGDE